jgi:Leucine-rich repeat (LRR) protein
MEANREVAEILAQSTSSLSANRDEKDPELKAGYLKDDAFTIEARSDHSGRFSYPSTGSLAKLPTFHATNQMVTDFTSLNLAGKQMRDFTFLPTLRTVAEVDLSENGLYYIPEELKMLKNLKRLCMNRNSIDSWEVVPRKLIALSLSQNLITDVPKTVSKLETLQFLDLSHNNIIHLGMLSKISTLEYLFLRCNQIQKCSELKVLNRLIELDLEKNMISNFEEIRYFEFCNSLKVLNVAGNPCTDDDENPGDPKSLRFLCTFPNCFGQGLYAKGKAELQRSLIYQAGKFASEISEAYYPSEHINKQGRQYFEIYCKDLGTDILLEDNSQKNKVRVHYKRNSTRVESTKDISKLITFQKESGITEPLGRLFTTKQKTISEPNTPMNIFQKSSETRPIKQMTNMITGQIGVLETKPNDISIAELPQMEIAIRERADNLGSRQPVLDLLHFHERSRASSPSKPNISAQTSVFGMQTKINNYMTSATKQISSSSVVNPGQSIMSPPKRIKLVSQFTFNATSKGTDLNESPIATSPNHEVSSRSILVLDKSEPSKTEKINVLQQYQMSPEKINQKNHQMTSMFNLSSGNRIVDEYEPEFPSNDARTKCDYVQGNSTGNEKKFFTKSNRKGDEVHVFNSSPQQIDNVLEPLSKSDKQGYNLKKAQNAMVNLIQRIKPVKKYASSPGDEILTVTVEPSKLKASEKCSNCSDLISKLQGALLRSKTITENSHLSKMFQPPMDADQILFLVEDLIQKHEKVLGTQKEIKETNTHLIKRIEKLEDALCNHVKNTGLSREVSPGQTNYFYRSNIQRTQPDSRKTYTRKLNPFGSNQMLEKLQPPTLCSYEPTDNTSLTSNLDSIHSGQCNMNKGPVTINQLARAHTPNQNTSKIASIPSKELQDWMMSKGFLPQSGNEPTTSKTKSMAHDELLNCSIQGTHRGMNSSVPPIYPTGSPARNAIGSFDPVAFIMSKKSCLQQNRFVSMSNPRLLLTQDSNLQPKSNARGSIGVKTPRHCQTQNMENISSGGFPGKELMEHLNLHRESRVGINLRPTAQKLHFLQQNLVDRKARGPTLVSEFPEARLAEQRKSGQIGGRVVRGPQLSLTKPELMMKAHPKSSRAQYLQSVMHPSQLSKPHQ